MVEIDNVSFSYDGKEEHKNLKNITLKVQKGECVLLCGESGCGKTTVTKLINGLIPHFENGAFDGNVTVDKMTVKDTPLYQLSWKTGSVFQNPKSQFFNIDSDSELVFGLENNGVDPEIIKKRTKQVIEELKIGHLLHRNVFMMSGGEKQSLAFASVYAMNPDVYVLDEPSANLDRKAVQVLKEQIRTIKEQGKTVIIAEHRLYYLKDFVDRVVFLKNGEIVKEYSQEEFLAMTEEKRHKLGLRTIIDEDQIVRKQPETSGELQIRNLTVRLKGKTIFQNVSFAASPGKVLGILGTNGAGKSTLLRCISGLINEAEGEILYKGRKMKPKKRNELCYMIMQDVNHQLFEDSVYNECLLSCTENATKEEIEEVLLKSDLIEFKDRHPMALSGGQKQRLAIVTGILAKKKVLLFDEPSSGLDYAHMCMVSKMLRRLSKEGHIVIVVTHDMELLNSACDEVLPF